MNKLISGFNKKNIRKITVNVFVLFISISPIIVFGQTNITGLVPCNGTTVPCDFGKFLLGIDNIIKFIVKVSIPIAAACFAYAGFLWLTSGANEGNRSTAKSIFTNVLYGFAIIFSAWLFVGFILKSLDLDTGAGYSGVGL